MSNWIKYDNWHFPFDTDRLTKEGELFVNIDTGDKRGIDLKGVVYEMTIDNKGEELWKPISVQQMERIKNIRRLMDV